MGHLAGALGAFEHRQDDAEAVVVQARHGIAFVHGFLDAFGGRLEQQVAGLSAEGMVDLPEAVQVDDLDPDLSALAARDRDRAFEAVVEQGLVRQPGERIVEGEVGLARLVPGVFARIGEHRDETGGGTVLGAQGIDG